MSKLREGWNITEDLTNPLEATCRKIYSMQDAALSVPSIFDSASLAMKYLSKHNFLF